MLVSVVQQSKGYMYPSPPQPPSPCQSHPLDQHRTPGCAPWAIEQLSTSNLFLFIDFNRRTMTLQYCDGFATHQYELTTGVCISSILKPLPQLFYTGRVHMSVPLPQSAPDSRAHLGHTAVLRVCVSIPTLKTGSSVPFF